MERPYMVTMNRDITNLAALVPQYANDLNLLYGDLLAIQKGTKVITAPFGKLYQI